MCGIWRSKDMKNKKMMEFYIKHEEIILLEICDMNLS